MISFWIDSLLPLITATLLLVISIVVYRENKKKDHINALEQNFDVLQRLNEAALQSDDNLLAAVKSVHADDDIDITEARKIFFAYLRVNRLLRAYEYGRIKALSQSEIDRIFTAYAGTLKAYETIILGLSERGYPADFADDLYVYIQKAKKPPKYQDLLAGVPTSDAMADDLAKIILDPKRAPKERTAMLEKLIQYQTDISKEDAKRAVTAE